MAALKLNELHMGEAKVIKLKAPSDEIVVVLLEDGLELFPLIKVE